MGREETHRILTKYTGRTGEHLDTVLRELDEAGLVITKHGFYSDLMEPLIKEE